jgi:hypothetical protein
MMRKGRGWYCERGQTSISEMVIGLITEAMAQTPPEPLREISATKSNQLEFLDHAPGSEVTLNGINKKWVRLESGEWEETPGGTKHKSLWERMTGRMFKRQ